MPKIDAATAMPLLARARRGVLDSAQTRTAARFALSALAERHPGHSVEVRVPFAGAVQMVDGPTHRRGTPPNVVELDADVFLALAIGSMTWKEARESGKISASGSRADLADFFPMFTSAALDRWAFESDDSLQ